MTGRGRRILVDNGVFEGETLWDYTFSMHGMHDALTRADDILADARAELEYVQTRNYFLQKADQKPIELPLHLAQTQTAIMWRVEPNREC